MTAVRSLPSLLLGLVLGALLTFVGIAQADRVEPQEPEVLVALAQLLETEHRRVDLLLDKGDVAGAIAALEALRDQSWPTREQAGDAGIVLKHDVYGRLARLRIDHPDVSPVPDDALLGIVDEGLGESFADLDTNPFTARLVALRGEVLEGLRRDDDALSAYEQALDMNRVLLARELGEGTE